MLDVGHYQYLILAGRLLSAPNARSARYLGPRSFRASSIFAARPRSCSPSLLLLQILELLHSCAKSAKLDEMARIEKQLVHARHIVDGHPLFQEIVQVLERILTPVPHMAKAEHSPAIAVDEALLKAGPLRIQKPIKHRSIRKRKRNIPL